MAPTPTTRSITSPRVQGSNAVAEGFRHLGFKDDHELNAAEWIVYDALYAYCQEMVRDGKPNGAFVPWWRLIGSAFSTRRRTLPVRWCAPTVSQIDLVYPWRKSRRQFG